MNDRRFAFRQLLKNPGFTCVAVLALALGFEMAAGRAAENHSPVIAASATKRPGAFPHRIWAACDFEGQTPDYRWFGQAETNTVPRYAGNRTALRATARPYRDVSAVMTGINPVPGPRMGKENGLFVRYFLKGGTRATFQHFSLTREDNRHIVVDGLTQGRWDEMLDFSQDSRRNDGTSGSVFAAGNLVNDLFFFIEGDGAPTATLLVDEVVLFDAGRVEL